VTRVDPRVYPLAAFAILFLGGEKFQFGFQLLQHGLRETVRQMKGHILGRLGAFKVRQVAAAAPRRPGKGGNANLTY